MLVLTREAGQSIILGDTGNIKFKILNNDGRFVRIGIEAPKEVLINREEIFKRIKSKSTELSCHKIPIKKCDCHKCDSCHL